MKTNKKTWELWENLTCPPDYTLSKTPGKIKTADYHQQDKTKHTISKKDNLQIQQLLDDEISTFCGHTTTLFADQNMLVVYGGATAENMLLPQGYNAWVLWLGSPNQGGLHGWKKNIDPLSTPGSTQNSGSKQKKGYDASVVLPTTSSGLSSGNKEPNTALDSKSPKSPNSPKSEKSEKTTTSGSSDVGGSDNDLGGSNHLHPVGVDLRASSVRSQATASFMSKPLKKLLQHHPRTKMRWECVNVQWPEEGTFVFLNLFLVVALIV